MSTQDVPGANPANHDVLAAGCWAEHEDGKTNGRAMRLATWNNAYETDDQDIADVVNAYFEYKGLLEPLQAEVDTVIEDAESHAELAKELAVV